MKHVLVLGGHPIEYELTRKRVKNINIRVRADGTVGVSAPHRVTDQEVETILVSRGDFILGALEKFSALAQQGSREPAYDQGEAVCLLGRKYPIRLQEGKKNRAELAGDEILLQLRNPSSGELRKKTMEDFYKAQCLAVTTELCRGIHPHLEPLGVPFPEIKVRSMTSRWGSCKPSDKRVTFAWQLVKAPVECVEYVVWHELIHFLHLNHSPAFYGCLEQFVPDWKARRQRLNSGPWP